QPVKKTEKKLKQSTNLSVEIKAIPLFFDEFDNDRIYERYDKHMTALEAFQKIFQGTNFDFSLGDQFDAVQWEGFGAGESRLETFKRALERYKCEFRISGNMIFLERRIGRDTQFQYRHRLNASNIEQEIDANEMWTFARGYGDYGHEGESTEDDKEDWERAKLEREYTSPLAKIIGIRHAPPLKNGNITTKSKMDRELKALVDESLKISVSADIYDLQKQGYPVAQSEVGDRVFLIDERIGLDDEVRVVSQSKTRNWKGDVIDLNITFGSEKIAKRHQTSLTTAAKEINDLIAGRKKLPYSILPAAEQAALKALNEARTELIFGNSENGVQGIIAQDKDDPNRMMWMNSAGWMISTDGGDTSKVAATADGIVAETIIGESLIGMNITSPDQDGYFSVHGSYAEFNDLTSGRRVDISPSGLYGYNANDDIRFQADSSLVTSAALGTSNLNVYLAADDTEGQGEVRAVKWSTLGGTGDARDYDYINVRLRSIKSPPGSNLYLGTDASEVRVMSHGFIGSGVYRDLRANKIIANDYEVNGGDILYLRANDRIRTYGAVSSSSLIDIETGRLYNNAIITNTDNGYIGVNNELRVVNKGLSGVYRDIRFGKAYANDYEVNGGNILYLRSNYRIRARRKGNSETYVPMQAEDFIQASSKEIKENIRDFNENATDILNGLKIVNFDYIDGEKNRVGVIAEDSDRIVYDDSVSLGDTLFLNTKSIQELSKRMDELEAKL